MRLPTTNTDRMTQSAKEKAARLDADLRKVARHGRIVMKESLGAFRHAHRTSDDCLARRVILETAVQHICSAFDAHRHNYLTFLCNEGRINATEFDDALCQ
jgi:hypothetical protein